MPASTSPSVPPVVAFALWELGWFRVQELPMMAAVWLAEGFDGPDLRVLAGLTRGEINEVREDLWRSALADAGVDVARVRVHRTAAPFLAERQLAGEMSERELCHTLWSHGEDVDAAIADEDLQAFVYRWDDLLDTWTRLRPSYGKGAPQLPRSRRCGLKARSR